MTEVMRWIAGGTYVLGSVAMIVLLVLMFRLWREMRSPRRTKPPMTTIDRPQPSSFEEIRALHLRHGADVDLAEPSGKGLPDGWQVVIRRWGFRCYDALIIAPPPQIGWRLAGDYARTAAGARSHAKREIEAHLARAA